MLHTLRYTQPTRDYAHMSDLRKKLGSEIKLARRSRNMTQEKLGLAISRDRPAISRIESSGKELTIDNLEKIASEFGIPTWQIVAAAEGAITHEVIELSQSLTKIGAPAIKLLSLVMDMRVDGKIDDQYLQSLADVISQKSRGGGAGEKVNKKVVKRSGAHEQRG